jgi:hypothetical protein
MRALSFYFLFEKLLGLVWPPNLILLDLARSPDLRAYKKLKKLTRIFILVTSKIV